MHLKKRIVSVIFVIVCTISALLYSTGPMRPADTGEKKSFLSGSGKETIYFWYTDENMTSFINSAAVSFSEEKGVRVLPVLVSGGEYLEAINEASLHSEQIPDVYLIGNDSLEKAYLAGLASETRDGGSVCNSENFPKAALNAVSFQGKNIAYPLYFETSVLLYNESYLEQWASQQDAETLAQQNLEDGIPGNLDELLYIADTFDVPEGVEGIMKWDVSDIFYNYWIVGHYLVVGGEAGDDENNIDINNEETIQCLEVYKALNQFFSMETDTIDYDAVIQDFIDGKIMFTVATSDVIGRLEAAREDGSFAFDYGVATMPDVSGELASASLSMTGAVAVNGYSSHKELANEFAAYLVTQRAEELYEKTGKIAARTGTDTENGPVQIFKQEYADSVSLPKMMETGNFWLQMEVLFAKVWNGADVETLVTELAEQITTQVSAQ